MRSSSIGQQGHVAVVVQLADRDPELVEVSRRTMASSSRAASSPTRIPVRANSSTISRRRRLGSLASAAMNLAAVGSSKNLGSGFVEGREVGRVDREPGRGVVVVPLDDPLEERAQHGEPVPDGGGRQGLASPSRTGGLPGLEVLDVARPMAATDTQVGSARVTRWAKSRRARSAALTVAGRAETSSCSR